MHLSPFEILLNLEVEFKQEISAQEQIGAVERLVKAIREKYPSITRIFIEARRGDAVRPSKQLDGVHVERPAHAAGALELLDRRKP
jgi:N-acetyl-anhydromuramyl-L-alanine amidase AmpD